MGKYFRLLFLGLMLSASRADAQIVDINSMVRSLAPESAGPIVRSLKANSGMVLSANQQIPIGMDYPTVSLQVEFAPGSHILTTQGMTTLRALAVALKDPKLAESNFQVGGHYYDQRDPLGAQPISHRRAAAVAEHLVAYYGIPRERLTPLGYGQAKLADPGNVASPLNTRIEIVNLTMNK